MRKGIATFLILFLSILTLKAQTTEDYIATHAAHAQELMRIHQLPASLILAIAIHESGAGKSKIARYLNNHFGVKGTNTNTEIRSAYRDYPSVDSSYNHFVSFLHSRLHFNLLFGKYDQYDFKNWALGIQRGGYAHSKTWASQVIGLINKYELFKYDERPADYISTVLPVAETPGPVKSRKVKTKRNGFYTVKKGDNLNQIASKNKTTATLLMQKNNLKSASLQPGQKIKL